MRTGTSLTKNGKVISREMIKESAIALFQNKGIDNTTVNEIARDAGIAKGTFYLYFENKNDLVNAVFEQFGREFLSEVIQRNIEDFTIPQLAQSILEFFENHAMFLYEVKNNLSVHVNFEYYKNSFDAFFRIITTFSELTKKYSLTQLKAYSEIIFGTLLDICYKYHIERSIQTREEAQAMLEDFIRRFFSCD